MSLKKRGRPREAISNPLTVQELAERLGLSRSTVYARFVAERASLAEAGCAPMSDHEILERVAVDLVSKSLNRSAAKPVRTRKPSPAPAPQEFVPSALEKARREHLVEVVREIEAIITHPASDLSPAQRGKIAVPVTLMVAEIAVIDGMFDRDRAGLSPYVSGIVRTLNITRELADMLWQLHAERVLLDASTIVGDWQQRLPFGKGRARIAVPRPNMPTWANLYITLKDWREAGILTRERLQRVFGREACLSGRVRIGSGISFETRSTAGTWQDTRIADFARDLSAAHQFGESQAGAVFAAQRDRGRKTYH